MRTNPHDGNPTINKVLDIAAVLWLVTSTTLCIMTAINLHIARNGPGFVIKGILLLLINEIAQIVLAIFLILPAIGGFTPFIMFVFASLCYFLKLTVYWVFAF